MIVKTFTGTSVRETLQKVRDAFGADAVILDTRVEDDGTRRAGLPRAGVVITAATEPQRTETPAGEGPRTLHLKGNLGEAGTVEPAATPAVMPAAEHEVAPSSPEAPMAIPTATAFETTPDWIAPVMHELQRISADLRAASGNDTLWETMRRWLAQQPSLASGIVDTFATYLVESLPPHHAFLNTTRDSQNVLIVGGRGVGKSTFLFKGLAARWQSVQRKPDLHVMHVAPDHGHERLQALSVGCGVQFNLQAIGQSRRLRIDSAKGISAFVEYVAGGAGDDVETHARQIRRALNPDIVALVLNATTSPSVWRRQLNHFALFAPTHLVFTHWDESQPWWEAVSFSGQSRLPLAYRIGGFEAFGEIDPFAPADIQAGVTDYVMRAVGAPDPGKGRKEDA